MKRTRFMTALIAIALVVSLMVSMGALTASAQELYEEIPDVGDSAYGDVSMTYVVTVYWDDDDNAYGTRPDEVEVILTAESSGFGVSEEHLCLNEKNGWENVRNSLPIYIHKGSGVHEIRYSYEIINLPEEYDVSIVQDGNWFKATCTLRSDTYQLGDADGDNDVTIVDATIIARYDAGMKVKSINPTAADVNGDQSADIIDSTIIQRYLIGMDCSRYDIGKEIK